MSERRQAVAFGVALAAAEGRLGVRAMLSSNPHYPSEAAVMTAALLVFSLLVMLVPWVVARRFAARWCAPLCLPATGVALALACVPLPPSDFFANGGTEHSLFLIPLLSVLAVPASFIVARLPGRAPTWAAVIAQSTLLAIAVLFGFRHWVEGMDSRALSERALLAIVPLAMIAAGSLALSRQK